MVREWTRGYYRSRQEELLILCWGAHTIGLQAVCLLPRGEARYVPRMFAEYFRRGKVVRAFMYELVDERDNQNDADANIGLVRHDLTDKPSPTP